MKVEQFYNANQFRIYGKGENILQSYNSTVVKIKDHDGNIENLAPEEVQSYYKDLFYRLFDILLTINFKKNSKAEIEYIIHELYYLFKKEI